MAWSLNIIYATSNDIEIIRRWVNSEPDVAWIVKSDQHDNNYTWRAVYEIEEIKDGHSYAIWHVKSGALNIPSGQHGVADKIVENPFTGWSQTLDHPKATSHGSAEIYQAPSP